MNIVRNNKEALDLGYYFLESDTVNFDRSLLASNLQEPNSRIKELCLLLASCWFLVWLTLRP
jgi:hypothetical protein